MKYNLTQGDILNHQLLGHSPSDDGALLRRTRMDACNGAERLPKNPIPEGFPEPNTESDWLPCRVNNPIPNLCIIVNVP